jgi:hypothetical protein
VSSGKSLWFENLLDDDDNDNDNDDDDDNNNNNNNTEFHKNRMRH